MRRGYRCPNGTDRPFGPKPDTFLTWYQPDPTRSPPCPGRAGPCMGRSLGTACLAQPGPFKQAARRWPVTKKTLRPPYYPIRSTARPLPSLPTHRSHSSPRGAVPLTLIPFAFVSHDGGGPQRCRWRCSTPPHAATALLTGGKSSTWATASPVSHRLTRLLPLLAFCGSSFARFSDLQNSLCWLLGGVALRRGDVPSSQI